MLIGTLHDRRDHTGKASDVRMNRLSPILQVRSATETMRIGTVDVHIFTETEQNIGMQRLKR